VGQGGREAKALGSKGRHKTRECCHPIRIERIQRPPSRVIVEVLGLSTWGNEPVGGLVMKKPWDQVELLIHKAQAIEDHRLDGMAHSDNPGLRVLLESPVNDGGNAKFLEHPGHQAKMSQDLTAIGLWQRWLLRRGDATNLPKLLQTFRGGAESRIDTTRGMIAPTVTHSRLSSAVHARPCPCQNRNRSSASTKWTVLLGPVSLM
jgi:hypothetical protein